MELSTGGQESSTRNSMQVALEWKDRGNAHYGQKEFNQAAKAYQAGLDALPQQTILTEIDGDGNGDALPVSLRSNLALTFIKLEDFDRAESICTTVLDAVGPHDKVLYRRAIAREGKGRRTNMALENQQRQFVLAMDDLQRCLDLLDQKDQQEGKSGVGMMKTRKQVRAALDRLESSYHSAADQTVRTKKSKARMQDNSSAPMDSDASSKGISSSEKEKSSSKLNGKSSGVTMPCEVANAATANNAERPLPPPVQKQRQDVMRLLMARKMAGATPNGEAFFLLEWKWWCHWCHRVDFFYNSDGEKNEARNDKILELLPTGAIEPTMKEDQENSSDDDEEDTFTSERDQALGPIDNSRLLLDPQSTFHQQWYLQGKEPTLPKHPDALLPNLVRGYHFELLPREVYNAFRSWYGEVTPSICRRTNEDGIIALYEPFSCETENPMPQLTAAPDDDVTRYPRCSACRAPRAVSRCKRCMSVQYCDRRCQEAHWPYHKILCKHAKANGSKLLTNDELSGKVGLNNLGNTCFMNSALQSLSHATPLVRHFLSNKFKADVNTSNPLGTGGKLAMTYDALMKELWMRNKGTSLSPTALKRAVSVFAPRFAGCLQHDAQEFLAYLLDGLHEDLNRIEKAPYVEMPDVTDGQNMAIAGAEAWDAHKRRNDSLVLDTFYGQFQSTCICPHCNRVSVSFDAFNHVSLEIPQFQKATMSIPVIVFRKPSNPLAGVPNPRIPRRYGVTLNRQCVVSDLKDMLAQLTDIPATHLILADIYENSIYELLNNKKSVSTIRSNDVIVAYEVDPYTNDSIHAVATQSLVILDKNGNEQHPNFGFPFVTSFDYRLTCREVWTHLWEIVEHFVRQVGSKEEFVDSHNYYRREDILTIRVVNNQGQPAPLFTTEGGVTTSAIPSDSDEELRATLGNECVESFLFLSLEWRNPTKDIDEEHADFEDGDTPRQRSTKPGLVRPKSFIAFEDHVSLLEVIERQRAKKNGSSAVSLGQCFDKFTNPERLDGNNQWYCSNCKDHVRAMKTMKLWRLPNILVVHLKRFEFKQSFRRDKLDTFVDFPLEGFDMIPHCSGMKETDEQRQGNIVDSKVDAKYDLFAVVNHYGRMGFGHYTAYCREWDEEGLSSQWYLYDDSDVHPVESSEVQTSAAYVLFYRRRHFH